MLTLQAHCADDYHDVLRTHSLVLVDFYKDQCPGCRMLDLALAQVAVTPAAAELVLLKVKMETVGEAFFRELGLRQTPTLTLVRDGRETRRLAGYQSPAQISAALAPT